MAISLTKLNTFFEDIKVFDYKNIAFQKLPDSLGVEFAPVPLLSIIYHRDEEWEDNHGAVGSTTIFKFMPKSKVIGSRPVQCAVRTPLFRFVKQNYND